MRKAWLLGLLLGALVLTACAAGTTPPSATSGPAESGRATLSAPEPADATPQTEETATASPALRTGDPAWVAVAVTTLWRSPDAPREVDAPALARPVRLEEWLADMTTAERRALNGRADTQALLGDRVRVVRLRPGWAKVVVPDQPSPLNARGYPGWVPRRQLTAVRPVRTPRAATVTKRTAWLRSDNRSVAKRFRVSFGTRFPILGTTRSFVRVSLPGGAVRRIAKTAVVRRDRDQPAFAPTRTSLVKRATSFTGLEYLWAGASGFGVDCSGLTWLTYRAHGLRIPRDAAPQSEAGSKAAPPHRGDLLFFGDPVHHVAMFVGNGKMVHAPGTGQTVEVIPRSTAPYSAEYVGARRLLP